MTIEIICNGFEKKYKGWCNNCNNYQELQPYNITEFGFNKISLVCPNCGAEVTRI